MSTCFLSISTAKLSTHQNAFAPAIETAYEAPLFTTVQCTQHTTASAPEHRSNRSAIVITVIFTHKIPFCGTIGATVFTAVHFSIRSAKIAPF
jgi:hypothetical protein